jgi:hypothetical protein
MVGGAMTGSQIAVGLVVLAVVLAVLAVLYGIGAVSFLTSTGSGPHTKHAILLGVLAVLSVIAANFARRRTA